LGGERNIKLQEKIDAANAISEEEELDEEAEEEKKEAKKALYEGFMERLN
jgi:hypothetical protein